ncbi:hypothetical protein F5884DRAFT_851017 [Xylogone sp. PMI_703]|nr:hypothetical protein F5884DRAFT_851017 [Xylogone sp. PMI_703]
MAKLSPAFFIPYPKDNMQPPEAGWMSRDFPTYDEQLNKLHHVRHVEDAIDLSNYFRSYWGGYRTRDPDADHISYNDEWVYKSIREYRFRPLWEYGPTPPEWGVEIVLHCENPDLPHPKCIMASDVDGQDELLYRGELLAIIRMIRGRLHTPLYV